jgi:hypothetical protein
MTKTTATLGLILLAVAPAQAGECIDWDDEACAICVRDLVATGKPKISEYKSYQHETPAALKGSECAKRAGSWYCFPVVCLCDAALEVIVGLDKGKDKARARNAAGILGSLKPFRSCGEEHVPALKRMLNHFPEATPGFRKSALKVLRNLRAGGKNWGEFARPCVEFLRRRIPEASGEIKQALYVGLARVAIWDEEKTLAALRQMPEVRKYAESRFPLPGCLKIYFGLEEQGLLRLTSDEFLRRLRNAVFARRGRRFKDKELQVFFDGQPWYKPRDGFSMRKLNQSDRINIRLVKEEERRRGGKSPP